MRKHGEVGTGMRSLHTSDRHVLSNWEPTRRVKNHVEHPRPDYCSHLHSCKQVQLHCCRRERPHHAFPSPSNPRARVYHHVNLSQGFAECEDANWSYHSKHRSSRTNWMRYNMMWRVSTTAIWQKPAPNLLSTLVPKDHPKSIRVHNESWYLMVKIVWMCECMF